MRLPRCGALLGALVLSGAWHGSVQAIEINFDDLPSFTTVTSQYPQATFSSSAGNENVAFANALANSPPNILCSGPIGSITCLEDTYIDFTAPVNDLTFWAIEANAVGVTAQFNVFESGSFAGTVDLVSSGGVGNNEFVDLTAFTNVTRLEIVNILNDPIDENGIGWDTFRFNVVPEPSTWCLASIGLLAAALGSRVRRIRP